MLDWRIPRCFWVTPLLVWVCAAQTPLLTQPTNSVLEGDWLGRLGEGDITAGALCSFTSNAAHVLTGTMTNGFAGVTMDLDDLRAESGKISFAIREVAGTFEGRFTSADRIDGTWKQRGISHPLWLVRTKPHPWVGAPGVLVSVKKPPTAVRAGGRYWLFYELRITNWSGVEMTLHKVELLLDDEALPMDEDLLAKTSVEAGVRFAPWATSMVLIQVADDSFPDKIRHRVTVLFDRTPQPVIEEFGPIPISHNVVKIAPPLAGGPWRAGSGPDSNPHHRAAFQPDKGELYVPERFAFDFSLRSATPEPQDRVSPSYGVPVLAVADAKVASVLDGIPDNVEGDLLPAIKLTRENSYGNSVILDLGQNRFASYCHLRAGLKVRAGDQVKTGQVLGAIGNSGGSFGAHLHFQVTDGRDSDASEGIPFELSSFTHEGTAVSNEMPLNEWSIVFPPLPEAAPPKN
jgi:hypothetical protein